MKIFTSPETERVSSVEGTDRRTVVSRSGSPSRAGKSFFFTTFRNLDRCSDLASTFFDPPARAQGRVCSVRTLPFPREAYRARGISRSAFKLQGPTDPPLDLRDRVARQRERDSSVHGQPTDHQRRAEGRMLPFRIPTSLRMDRRDTRFAKGPSAECRPQDETPASRKDRRRFHLRSPTFD